MWLSLTCNCEIIKKSSCFVTAWFVGSLSKEQYLWATELGINGMIVGRIGRNRDA